MPTPSKQAPPPLQVDTARVVVAGIALWAVAAGSLVTLIQRVVTIRREAEEADAAEALATHGGGA